MPGESPSPAGRLSLLIGAVGYSLGYTSEGTCQVAKKSDSEAKRRRQKGEGGLYRRQSDGLWVGVVDLGWRNGKRDRKTVSSKSFKTAQAKLNKIKKQLAEHGDLPTAERTLEQWLNIWLEKIIKKRARPGTYRRYKEHAEFHFIPAAGKKKLSRLTTDDVRAIHDHYRDAGLSAASAAG